jgi:hypothetical protein
MKLNYCATHVKIYKSHSFYIFFIRNMASVDTSWLIISTCRFPMAVGVALLLSR